MLKPYLKYKDSNNPWIGTIPENWDVLPTRKLFFEVKERGYVDEQLLSVTISKGVIRQADMLLNSWKKDSSNEDKSKYKLVVPGDIAYNKMRAWQGAVGCSSYRGIVSPAYIIVRMRHKYNPRYFHYLLRTPSFAKEAERWSYGITSDQWSLRPEHFKMIYCSVPSESEQNAIVAFLDNFDTQVRRYILRKQQVIKYLNEQKRAIINKAITRGINPNVALKSSGIAWLRDIPSHWQIIKLRSILSLTSIKNHSELPLLSVVREKGVIRRSEMKDEENRNFIPDDLKNYKVVREGDLAINKMKAWQGSLGISTCDGIVSPAYYVYKVSFKNKKYLHLALRSGIYKNFFAQASDGVRTGQWDLSSEKLKDIPLIFPPEKEQDAIVEHINKAFELVASKMAIVQKELSLIEEYRVRLISDVVTGKADVRDIRLSEVSDIERNESVEDQEKIDANEEAEEAVNADE